MRTLTAAATALILALTLAGCGGDDDAATSAPTNPPAVTEQPAAVDPTDLAEPAPTATPLTLRDGIYEVGAQIPAGRYTTTSGGGAYRCYWARLRSFGEPDSVIADDNLAPHATATVDVLPTDRGFKVANGCEWTYAGQPS